jgi:hypothetical protein
MHIEGQNQDPKSGHLSQGQPGSGGITAAQMKDAEDIVCEACGCNVFQETIMLKKVSKFLTGSEKDSISPIPVITCAKCQNINEMFKPQL